MTPYACMIWDKRRELGFTQRDTAKFLGVSPPMLSAVERHRKKVPISWLDRLAEHFELSEAEVVQLHLLALEHNDTCEVTAW